MKPHLIIRVEIYQPGAVDDGLIFSNQHVHPVEWIEKRYFGYLAFDFEEMVDELRNAVKGPS